MPRHGPSHRGWLTFYSELMGSWRARRHGAGDAEDATQDVVVRLLENGVGAIHDVRAYLARGTYNRMISQHRAQAVREAVPWHDLPDQHHPLADGPEEQYRAAELADALVEALCDLPLACQEVFKLHRLDGWTQAQIAERLGISRNMVERHMMRAMRHLQDRLLP